MASRGRTCRVIRLVFVAVMTAVGGVSRRAEQVLADALCASGGLDLQEVPGAPSSSHEQVLVDACPAARVRDFCQGCESQSVLCAHHHTCEREIEMALGDRDHRCEAKPKTDLARRGIKDAIVEPDGRSDALDGLRDSLALRSRDEILEFQRINPLASGVITRLACDAEGDPRFERRPVARVA